MRSFLLRCLLSGLALTACGPLPAAAAPLDLTSARVIDLTHAYDERTLYWPSAANLHFELEQLAYGPTPGGYFYSANRFCTPEHGGTHLDAPIHFAEGKRTVDQIPVRQLVAPAVVIDVAAKAAADPDYRLTPADVEAFEQAHGRIAAGTLVLLRTGWSARWGDRKAYFGDDKPGDASNLHFPSYGAEAARLLVEERGVGALGVDTASIDHGPSKDFLVHRIAAAREVPGFENLTNLEQLPPTGAWLVALPMKVGSGSGGPLRAIALLPAE
jgi:kynurenine formamidase